MRIAVRRSGGFANVGAHAEVETSELPRGKADEAQRLVKALPDLSSAPSRAADAYQYEITIDGKTYRAGDDSLPAEWRALVDFLLDHPADRP
jgi:hypothetical protein